MLATQLEKTLPTGSIIVAVGGGDNCLTEAGKKWLAKIAGVKKPCCPCQCQETDEYDRGYSDGYDDAMKEADAAESDSYNDGYRDGQIEIGAKLAEALTELGLD